MTKFVYLFHFVMKVDFDKMTTLNLGGLGAKGDNFTSLSEVDFSIIIYRTN